MGKHPPFLLLVCSFCSFSISSNMRYPHPPSPAPTKTTLVPNWHRELIIQRLVGMLALCANQKWVAHPAAASWPTDLQEGCCAESEISTEDRQELREGAEEAKEAKRGAASVHFKCLRISEADSQIRQSCEESTEVQNKGATALSPNSGTGCYRPVSLALHPSVWKRAGLKFLFQNVSPLACLRRPSL